MNRPKTLQIFLPDGSPRSIRIAEITSRIVKVVAVPRNKLEEAAMRDELYNVGVYFLFGQDDQTGKDMSYIGEAENCYERLKQHHKSKDFWNIALVVVSKTNSYTKSHIKFLEHICYKEAATVNRYLLENKTIPTQPFITEPMIADLFDDFDSIKILTSSLGYPLYESLHKNNVTSREIFYCKGKGALAKGEYTDEGFVVLKGSTANIAESASAGSSVKNNRDKLKNDGTLVLDNEYFCFTKDTLFSSPSAAAVTVLGRRANGWTEGKLDDGKTLDQMKRN